MIVLSFPLPGAPWSLNAERTKHWSWRSRQVRAWRTAALAAATVAGVGQQPRCRVHVALPFERAGRRDPSNYLPPVKAIIDGLVDAGLWVDDTPEFVVVEEPTLVVGGQRVVVTVEPLERSASRRITHECTLCRAPVTAERGKPPTECDNCGGTRFRRPGRA